MTRRARRCADNRSVERHRHGHGALHGGAGLPRGRHEPREGTARRVGSRGRPSGVARCRSRARHQRRGRPPGGASGHRGGARPRQRTGQQCRVRTVRPRADAHNGRTARAVRDQRLRRRPPYAGGAAGHDRAGRRDDREREFHPRPHRRALPRGVRCIQVRARGADRVAEDGGVAARRARRAGRAGPHPHRVPGQPGCMAAGIESDDGSPLRPVCPAPTGAGSAGRSTGAGTLSSSRRSSTA